MATETKANRALICYPFRNKPDVRCQMLTNVVQEPLKIVDTVIKSDPEPKDKPKATMF